MHPAGDQVGQCRRAALVGHMGHVDPGHRFEQFGRKNARCCRSRVCHRTTDRVSISRRRSIRRRTSPGATGDRTEIRNPGNDDHRREIPDRVVRQALVDVLIDGVGARRADDEGVSVGIGLRDRFGGDVAAGTRLVLDEELPANSSEAWAATTRARMSVVPPAANGTINLTGRAGHCSARAPRRARQHAKCCASDQDGAAGEASEVMRGHLKRFLQ